jgi:hypothetical protein
MKTCYVQLGRFGDIMIMMPGWKYLHDTTGERPNVISCAEFSTIFDGCLYVKPFPVEGFSWFKGVGEAVKLAQQHFDKVIVPKWWDCPGMEPPEPPAGAPYTEITHMGRSMKLEPEEWDSYQYSQWKACGFTKEQMMDLPLVFDQRNPDREAFLIRHHMQLKKPAVLYNFSGISNPVGLEPEIMRVLLPLKDRVELIDLSRIHAHRIYDLLGMYDHAACLITGDTATLHLAAASKVPTVALLANGGAGSIPKCQTVMTIRYNELLKNLNEIRGAVENQI